MLRSSQPGKVQQKTLTQNGAIIWGQSHSCLQSKAASSRRLARPCRSRYRATRCTLWQPAEDFERGSLWEIGIDSFAAILPSPTSGILPSAVDCMADLLEEVEVADRVGLDVFGIGEHHRAEFLDSAPAIILAAAAR